MPILHETRFDLEPGKFDAFQEWLLENEEALAAAYPDGIEYVGSYANVFGDPSKGEYKTLLRLDDYAAIDKLTETVAQEGDLSRLLWEMSAYTKDGSSSRGQKSLWKRVTHAVATGD